MKTQGTASLFACGAAALAMLTSSCATINKLDKYDIANATLAASMRVPPQPTFNIHYSVKIDAKDPIGTAFSVGTNLAKAEQAEKAEGRMREALASVDVPEIVLRETSAACIQALGAKKAAAKMLADYLLDLEIREYGVNAASAGSSVSLRMHMTASLHHNRSGELVWRRDINVDNQASPDMFGGGQIVGNLVTAMALSELSVDQLAKGFEQLAVESARSVARRLENDLYSARYQDR